MLSPFCLTLCLEKAVQPLFFLIPPLQSYMHLPFPPSHAPLSPKPFIPADHAATTQSDVAKPKHISSDTTAATSIQNKPVIFLCVLNYYYNQILGWMGHCIRYFLVVMDAKPIIKPIVMQVRKV